MKRASLVLLVSAACGSSKPAAPPMHAKPVPPAPATLVIPKASGPGTIETHTFHSSMLGVDKSYVVYLPGGYGADKDARWPVLYYLNGLGGDETNWSQLGDLGGAADKLGLAAIVVMPDGDDGFYANSVTPRDYDACMKDGTGLFDAREDPAHTCVRKADYEDYIVKELVAYVDKTYLTIDDRRARGIAGDSMGGFGALELAMRHTDVFSAAASHSGVDALLYVGPHPYEAGKAVILDDVKTWGAVVEPIGGWVRAIFGPDRADWEQHDPAFLAAKLTTDPFSPDALAIYLDCGTEDIFGLDAEAAYLHDVLTKRGVAHSYYEGPGRHDFDFWKERLPHSLAFFAAHFAGQPEPVETPATAPAAAVAAAPKIEVLSTLAGAGLSDDLVDHLREGIEEGARVCMAKSHPAEGTRELAIGLTAQAEIGDVRWIGDSEPDDFDECLVPQPPMLPGQLQYVYIALSIMTPAEGKSPRKPSPPSVAEDLDGFCHAYERAGVAPSETNSTSRISAWVASHVRHPDTLAMLHEMAISDPKNKSAIVKAALAKAKIPLAKCPLMKGA